MLFAQIGRKLVSPLRRTSFVVSRCMSAASDNLLVDLDSKTGVAVVKMNRPPVNSYNLEFLTDFNIVLEKLENDRTCRGMILTSNNNKVFSAGLHILEMYQPQPDRLAQFWRSLQSLWINLYTTRLATIAAINGHSPAGGCLVATCCDYRMMAPNFTIGLNETQLGIIPPFWFVDSMINVIGYRQTERCCQQGLMVTSEQALKLGMVDDVVVQEALMDKAHAEMKNWLKVPDFARQITKTQMRKATVDKLLSKREEDIENFVSFITKDSVQKALGMYLEAMKKKEPKK